MIELLQSIGGKIAAVIIVASAAIGGFAAVIQTKIAPPENTASVYDAVSIPHAKDPFLQAATAPKEASVATSTNSVSSSPAAPTPSSPTVAATKRKTPPEAQKNTASKIQAIAPRTITTQWLLDNTKFSLRQTRSGIYEASFSVNIGGDDLAWSAGDTSIGGGGVIPKFVFSFSCDPPLELPFSDSPDQTPFFKVRSSYDCTIGFAATSGNDQRQLAKKLHADAGPGQFVVTPPSAMNAVLANDTNNGGFVLEDQDSKQITVTKLTLDVSYTGLNVRNNPLVLQIIDPSTDAPLFEYHMENIALDPSLPYTHAAIGIEVPLSFTLRPGNKKLLPVKILGVELMRISGLDPTVTVALRAITTDPGDVKQIINAARIGWSCIVPLTGYDPNATSGPFAAGDACK